MDDFVSWLHYVSSKFHMEYNAGFSRVELKYMLLNVNSGNTIG